MPDFILTTCGTSLLTNGADEEVRKLIGRTANLSDNEVPSADRRALEEIATERRRRLAQGDIDNAAKMSAEINGLSVFYGHHFTAEAKRRDVHYFLASDTYLGRLTRDLATDWMRAQGFEQVVPLDVGGLRTSSLADFRIATTELTERLDEIVRSQRAANLRCRFNLAGGFKSVNAYLQLLGALWADEVFFVFETSRELIRIPKLPLSLDIEGTVRAELAVFRRLAVLGSAKRADVGGLPDALVLVEGDSVGLSPWAEAALAPLRHQLYGEAIWHPWYGDVAFGPSFLSTTASLAPDRRRKVNERIDDLCRYAATGLPLARLDLKALKGGSIQGSTHEADAWADGSADRLFLHREGVRWVIDRLGPALH